MNNEIYITVALIIGGLLTFCYSAFMAYQNRKHSPYTGVEIGDFFIIFLVSALWLPLLIIGIVAGFGYLFGFGLGKAIQVHRIKARLAAKFNSLFKWHD